MIFYSIVHSKKGKDDLISFGLADGSQLIFRDIRAGISWPEHSKPGYYCIVGQKKEKSPAGRFPLELIAEGEAVAFQDLFRILGDDAKLTKCNEVYGDIAEDREAFRDAFWGSDSLKGVSIQQAPWGNNFSFGIQLLQSLAKDKLLTINTGATLARQLGTISEAALCENPEALFYAVDAFRHVVSAFKRWTFEDEELPLLSCDDDRFYGEPWSIEDFVKNSI